MYLWVAFPLFRVFQSALENIRMSSHVYTIYTIYPSYKISYIRIEILVCIHLEDATSQVVSLHWSWNVDGLGHRLNYPKNVSTTQRCKDWDQAKMFVMFLHMSNLVSLGC